MSCVTTPAFMTAAPCGNTCSAKVDEFNSTSSPSMLPKPIPSNEFWWHLHEDLTRNHRCRSLDELLEQVYEWTTGGSLFSNCQLSRTIHPCRLALRCDGGAI